MTENSDIKSWEFPSLDSENPTTEEKEESLFIGLVEKYSEPTKSLEEIQKEAFEQAYQEGFKKGEEAAFTEISQKLEREYQEKWQERFENIQNVLKLLETPLSQLDEAIEQQLLVLIKTLAEKLVRQELSLHPEKMLSLIKILQDEMGHGHHLKIHLHPEQYQQLENLLKENISGQIIKDESLNPGDILMESDSGALRALLNERIEQLLQQI